VVGKAEKGCTSMDCGGDWVFAWGGIEESLC
jgi:hypothetical protein